MFGSKKMQEEIAEIKQFVFSIKNHSPSDVFEDLKESVENIEATIEAMKETIDDSLDRTDEYSPINIIQERLDKLLKDEKHVEKVELAIKTLDKFEDYMKNVDKLNGMVNEIKGVASMTRANMHAEKDYAQNLKDLSDVMKTIFASQSKIQKQNEDFDRRLFNLNAQIQFLVTQLCEMNKRKALAPKKTRKKKEV